MSVGLDVNRLLQAQGNQGGAATAKKPQEDDNQAAAANVPQQPPQNLQVGAGQDSQGVGLSPAQGAQGGQPGRLNLFA